MVLTFGQEQIRLCIVGAFSGQALLEDTDRVIDPLSPEVGLAEVVAKHWV